MIKSILAFLAPCFLVCTTISAQVTTGSPSNQRIQAPNKAVLAHYTSDELTAMQATDSVKYKSLIYYYSQSFILEPIACTDCVQKDMSDFDVSLYEKDRKKSERFTRDFNKYGVRLILLSVDELKYKLPIHTRRF